MIGNLTVMVLLELIVSILFSLVLHEFMHAYAGSLLGDTTAEQRGRLSLNPLRHIDPFMTVALPIL
ncbi:MAG: site-2 protease family protein, partial [Candidatus Micrarchaeaceae archaeon]